MDDKIIVGMPSKGLVNNRIPTFIDNDSFPTLINAYQWRGRVKRKRGTEFLGRLAQYFNSTIVSYGSISSINLVAGAANLITGFSLNTDATIVESSVTIINTTVPQTYTDNGLGILTGNLGGTGTINYASGAVTIAGGAGNTITASFRYYPNLPVMGFEDLSLDPTQFPGTIAFNTKKAFNVVTALPYPNYNISFYKNLASGTYAGYVQKTNWSPTIWNGQDYQQFWSTNYEDAFWVTNGITIPFTTTNIGMQYKVIVTVTVLTATTATLQITAHGLTIGDFVFVNEVLTTTGINFQTGYVTTVTDANNVIVTFPSATLATNGTGGIAQYLTRQADPTLDCIRWYDGDPTNGSVTTPVFATGKGWVNFMPPLSKAAFSINRTPPAQYYLAGGRMILPFKNRLVVFGPVIQRSGGSPIYLPDTVIYSQDGTPYYTASFTGDPSLATTTFTPLLTPTDKTATPSAWWEDQTGFGGFTSAGVDQALVSAQSNQDVIICGFQGGIQANLIFTGNDIVPFNFYLISSELNTESTFSAINMGSGVLSRGSRGYILTTQDDTNRTDIEIPDEVFQIRLIDNGAERMTAQRDFLNEWIYFTYPSNENESKWKYPTETLFHNYRDGSWAIFRETYTHYGQFRKQTGYTWQTVGLVYSTWQSWNTPWNSGTSTLLQPEVVGGNTQGFLMITGKGTSEGTSLFIKNITLTGLIESPNHCLNNGDFIIISGAQGAVGVTSYGQYVNNKIFSVFGVTQNTFRINPSVPTGLSYTGGGLITRMYVPKIQTKQFPPSWGMARKTRLGVQQYMFTTTPTSQITLEIYLSTNSSNPYNTRGVVPEIALNNSLVYGTVLYTCPESTNLGLTPANVNLQMPTATQQSQIWHRKNTSLLGDTIQLGFTLNETQMRSLDPVSTTFAITGATQANPVVLNTTGKYSAGQLVSITGVLGMTQLNDAYPNTGKFSVLSSTPTTVTINANGTGFNAYVSGGRIVAVNPNNQFAEIEMHAFILNISPSQLLA